MHWSRRRLPNPGIEPAHSAAAAWQDPARSVVQSDGALPARCYLGQGRFQRHAGQPTVVLYESSAPICPSCPIPHHEAEEMPDILSGIADQMGGRDRRIPIGIPVFLQ
jgi:hypothetical protein